MSNLSAIPVKEIKKVVSPFPLDQWYVAGFSSELTDKPLGRTYLNQKVVLFRTGEGSVAALEDRCCHKSLPLSWLCGVWRFALRLPRLETQRRRPVHRDPRPGAHPFKGQGPRLPRQGAQPHHLDLDAQGRRRGAHL